MNNSENRNGSQVKFIAGIIVLSICISIITSSIVVKTLIPTLSTPSSTPILLPPPAVTLTATQAPISLTSTILPFDLPDALTPMQIQMPRIENNLLKNNGFENGLSGWTYSDNVAGINVFETTGINGKAFCSRRYMGSEDFLDEEWAGFVQEVQIDPTQAYFFQVG